MFKFQLALLLFLGVSSHMYADGPGSGRSATTVRLQLRQNDSKNLFDRINGIDDMVSNQGSDGNSSGLQKILKKISSEDGLFVVHCSADRTS